MMNAKTASKESTAVDVHDYVHALGVRAVTAARQMARAETAAKNQALEAIAVAIESRRANMASTRPCSIDWS